MTFSLVSKRKGDVNVKHHGLIKNNSQCHIYIKRCTSTLFPEFVKFCNAKGERALSLFTFSPEILNLTVMLNSFVLTDL